MLIFCRRIQQEERGSTLLEYAIVFMLFMSLLMGICGFGHALYAYHFVSHAAKSAARWAAVNGSSCGNADGQDSNCTSIGPADDGQLQNYVKGMTPSGINPGNLTATAAWLTTPGTAPGICTTASNAPGCTVQVTVNYRFKFMVPLVYSGSLPMSSTAEMVIAH